MIGDLIKVANPDLPYEGPNGNRKRKKRGCFWWFVLICLVGGLLGLAVGYLYLRPFYDEVYALNLDEIDDVEKASIIMDRNGDELGRIYVENRRPISIDDIPNNFVQALVAAEDSRFFEHNGVDWIGTSRAILRTIRAKFQGRSSLQGGSTITQQLARNSFDIGGRTLQRKFKEVFLAGRIEDNFEKAEILELYLNRIYFGSGYYGIEAAAIGYFGKPAKELTIGESAAICGIIKAPHRLSLHRNPEDATVQRDYVLDRMATEHLITKEDAERWKSQPLEVIPGGGNVGASYVYEAIRQQIIGHVGYEKASAGGFTIETTIDLELQNIAEESLSRRLAGIEALEGYPHETYQGYHNMLVDYEAKLAGDVIAPDTPRPKPQYLQGALTMIDNHTGGVIALVGGRDFADNQYNRALQGSRPAGTAFTPFVYAAAFETGDTFPGTAVSDSHIDNRRVMIGGFTGILGEWGAESATNEYLGDITARQALVLGKNAATVRVGELVGVEAIKKLAVAAGIEKPLYDYPSSFLGSSEAGLSELTIAYTVFPEGGSRPKETYFIRSIRDGEGKMVYQREEKDMLVHNVLSPIAAYQTHSCLAEVTKNGTGAAAAEVGLADFPHGAKTGTHYNFTDLWFLGYTSEVTCGVWAGFDRPKSIYRGAFSNAVTMPIWIDAMNAAAKKFPPQEIPLPEGAETVEFCRTSGLRATDSCYEKVDLGDGKFQFVRSTYTEAVKDGFHFGRFCHIHSDSEAPHSLLASPTAENQDDSLESGTSSNTSIPGIAAIRMRAPTVIGDDPYDAIRPILKAMVVEEETPSEEDGGPKVMKARPVAVPQQEKKKNLIELTPPTPLEEFD